MFILLNDIIFKNNNMKGYMGGMYELGINLLSNVYKAYVLCSYKLFKRVPHSLSILVSPYMKTATSLVKKLTDIKKNKIKNVNFFFIY